MELEFLGAGREVGRSAILLRTGKENILMDYGMKISPDDIPEYPERVVGRLDGLLLSHAHLDHSGNIPALFNEGKKFKIHALKINKHLIEMLWEDTIKIAKFERQPCSFNKTDVRIGLKNFQSIHYREPFMIGNSKVTAFDAGHIPGSSMFMVESNGKKILYTGDFNWADTKLIKGCEKKLPKVDVLITESTYFKKEHPQRETEEKRMIKAIRETLDKGEPAIVASFAISRAQELLLILDEYGIDVPIYIDGMAQKATEIFNKFPNLLRDFNSVKNAMVSRNVRFVKGSKRKKILKEPCVIITTSGMLSGGPVAYYIEQLYDQENSSLLLTGFQVEDSEGFRLMKTGRYIHDDLNLNVKMRVEKFKFSGHADNSEIIDLIKKTQPKEVFCVHGENTEEFAKFLNGHGIYAKAPFNGELVEI